MNTLTALLIWFRQKLRSYNTVVGDAAIAASASVVGSSLKGNIKIACKASVEGSILSGQIAIGEGSVLQQASISGVASIGPGCKLSNCNVVGQVSIGRNTSLWGPDADVVSSAQHPVSIGSFCSIARNVSIQTYNHNARKATTYFIGKNFFREKWENEEVGKGGVTIGNDVWIGTQSVVLGGISVGDGAVIAANSLVNKDVPPYAIVAGSPAKIIGYRFDDELIAKLLKLQWWNWTDDQLRANKSFFENELTHETVEKYST